MCIVPKYGKVYYRTNRTSLKKNDISRTSIRMNSFFYGYQIIQNVQFLKLMLMLV